MSSYAWTTSAPKKLLKVSAVAFTDSCSLSFKLVISHVCVRGHFAIAMRRVQNGHVRNLSVGEAVILLARVLLTHLLEMGSFIDTNSGQESFFCTVTPEGYRSM